MLVFFEKLFFELDFEQTNSVAPQIASEETHDMRLVNLPSSVLFEDYILITISGNPPEQFDFALMGVFLIHKTFLSSKTATIYQKDLMNVFEGVMKR